MAKPVELGLELEGKDAIRLERYLKNPRDTPQGRKLMRNAEHLAKQLKW